MHRMDTVIFVSNMLQYPYNFLKERISTGSLAIGFNSEIFLVKPVNKLIGFYMSSGLMNLWINRHVDYRLYHNLMHPKKHPKVLIFQDLSPVFYICGALLLMSFAVFILEIVTHVFKNPFHAFVQ